MKQEEKVRSCTLPIPVLLGNIADSLILIYLNQNLISHGYKALVKLQQWLAEGQE